MIYMGQERDTEAIFPQNQRQMAHLTKMLHQTGHFHLSPLLFIFPHFLFILEILAVGPAHCSNIPSKQVLWDVRYEFNRPSLFHLQGTSKATPKLLWKTAQHEWHHRQIANTQSRKVHRILWWGGRGLVWGNQGCRMSRPVTLFKCFQANWLHLSWRTRNGIWFAWTRYGIFPETIKMKNVVFAQAQVNFKPQNPFLERALKVVPHRLRNWADKGCFYSLHAWKKKNTNETSLLFLKLHLLNH